MSDALPADLLAILVCPETHQNLSLAPASLLGRMQAAQQDGRLVNRAGAPVGEPFEAALVREDGQYAYRVSDQIPIMLIDEAIALDQPALNA